MFPTVREGVSVRRCVAADLRGLEDEERRGRCCLRSVHHTLGPAVGVREPAAAMASDSKYRPSAHRVSASERVFPRVSAGDGGCFQALMWGLAD